MLTVVCYKWGSAYRSEHVNRLADMVDAHLSVPHEIVCVTDNPAGVRGGVRIEPVDMRLIPLGRAFPKLSVWGKGYGRRMLFLDLDVTITRPIDHIVDRDEPVVLLGEFPYVPKSPTKRPAFYNTSVLLIDADAAPQVWTDFDPAHSVEVVRESRMIGSDQSWVSLKLGPDVPTFPEGEVASFRFQVAKGIHPNAAIVVYHGKPKPWG